MLRVRFLEHYAGKYLPGDEADLDETRARTLIERGFAVQIGEVHTGSVDAPKASKTEGATGEPQGEGTPEEKPKRKAAPKGSRKSRKKRAKPEEAPEAKPEGTDEAAE